MSHGPSRGQGQRRFCRLGRRRESANSGSPFLVADAGDPWHRALVPLSDDGFVPLFNGRDLTGWFATPRTYGELWPGGPTVADVAPGLLADDYDQQAARHPAVWTVEDGTMTLWTSSPANEGRAVPSRSPTVMLMFTPSA